MMGCVETRVGGCAVCFGDGGRVCWEMDLNINAGRSSLTEDVQLLRPVEVRRSLLGERVSW